MFNPTHPPAHWLKLLRENPSALDWPERSELPREAARWTALHPDDETGVQLLELLATDPKWEVRRAVAETLAGVPEPLYSRVAPILSNDDYYYVGVAAKAAVERRESPKSRARSPRQKGRRQLLREFRERYGEAAARLAERYADEHTNEAMRAVAHDLRTAIAPLEIGLSMAAHKEEMEAGILTARRAVGGFKALIDAIGDFARPREPVMETMDLVSIVHQAAEAAKVALRSQEQDIEPVHVTIHGPSPVFARASRPHLLMALTNLMKNAIESHGQMGSYYPGNVTVALTAGREHAFIVVADDGCGIRESNLVRLQEFWPGASNKSGGTGFGLPIAKRYLQIQGGALKLESEFGVGTTATVRLPLVKTENE